MCHLLPSPNPIYCYKLYWKLLLHQIVKTAKEVKARAKREHYGRQLKIDDMSKVHRASNSQH